MRLIAVSHAAILDINRRLFVELARRGHRVLLVVPTHWTNEYGAQPLRPEPLSRPVGERLLLRACRLVMAGKTALQLYLTAWLGLARWRPDAVFIDEEPWSLAALQWTVCARLAGAAVIVYTKENRRRRYPPPFSWINRVVLASADHILAISKDTVAALEARRPGFTSRVSIFPHAVDDALFAPDVDWCAGQRAWRGQDVVNEQQEEGEGLLLLGFVGRVAPEKGLETVLRATALLVEQAHCDSHQRDRSAPTIQVHIFGAGESAYLERLHCLEQELALPTGVVRWHGAVAHHDVPDAMRSLDVLVVPTVAHEGYKEQFGRVVIEALACGVPVIASDNGELPRLVERTGGGVIFPQGDVAALAARVSALLAQRATLREMGRRGRDYVCAHYTYGVLADELEGIMARLSVRDREGHARI